MHWLFILKQAVLHALQESVNSLVSSFYPVLPK